MAYEDEVIALEQAIIADFAQGWVTGIASIKRLLALESPDVARAVLALTLPSIHDLNARAAILQAFDLGAAESLQLALGFLNEEQLAQAYLVRMTTSMLNELTARLVALQKDATAALDKALKMIATNGSDEDITAALFASRTAIEREIGTIINDASNNATLQMAVAVDMPLVWVAERDACVRCLAHEGHVVARAGQDFPAGLTFGPYQYDDATNAPPLHPNCRCHLEILNSMAYAEALRREAIRSVLRGYSLESESMRVRLYAAQQLLNANVDAPKSVIAIAEAAIDRGAFNTRLVPA